MKRVQRLVFTSLAFLAMADAGLAYGHDREVRPESGAVEKTRRVVDVPQMFVVCTGWHALCTASPDCRMDGDKAYCDCMRVDENHIVATSEIQDAAARRLTEATCTDEHPCDVDEAPVCRSIRSGRYRVDGVRYDWVSTYSYRGWCSLLKLNLRACDVNAAGYDGDRYWAICDAAPCTEIENPSDPERPLRCECRVDDIPFVGMKDSCTGDDGGIMSSMPLWAWDFENDTYPFAMPGYDYVRSACASLKSDRWEEPRRDGEPR